MRFNGRLSAEISEKMNGTKNSDLTSIFISVWPVTQRLFIKRNVTFFGWKAFFFFFPLHTVPADRWSLFPSDPSKEVTLIRPKCSIIYSLLASPRNSLLRLNKRGEGEGVKTTCHESHMRPNLHALIKCHFLSIQSAGRAMTRNGLHNPQSFRLATKTDLGPPFDLAFLDLSGKPRTRICKYRHTDNHVGAHTQTWSQWHFPLGLFMV